MVESLVNIIEGGYLLLQFIRPDLFFFLIFYSRPIKRTQLNVSLSVVDPGKLLLVAALIAS